MNRKIILVLDNIRSTHNVGAIFRTADAVHVAEIFLVGITPDPIDRFGRKRADIAKASLGAENTVKWKHFSEAEFLEKVSDLKQEGFKIVGIEQSENSVDYKKVEIGENAVIIMGAEVEGVNPDFLAVCDEVAEIPMSGEKESLNVSVATGVALYRLLNL